MLPSGILVIILIKKDHVETINFVINRTWTILIWNFVKVNVRIEHISCPTNRHARESDKSDIVGYCRLERGVGRDQGTCIGDKKSVIWHFL